MNKKIEKLIEKYGDEYLTYCDENDIRQMCDLGREEYEGVPRCDGFDENKEFFIESDEGLVSASEEEVNRWIREK